MVRAAAEAKLKAFELCKTRGRSGVSAAAGAVGSLKAKAFELLSPFEERGWSPFADTPSPAAAPKPEQGRRERNARRVAPARPVRPPREVGWNSLHHKGGSPLSYDAAAHARNREEDEERARSRLAENQSRYQATLLERKWHAAGGAYYKTPPQPRPVRAAAPMSEPDGGSWFAEAQAQLLSGLASLVSLPPAEPRPAPVSSEAPAWKERAPRPERQWLVLRVREDRPGAGEVRVRASLAALVSDVVAAVEEDNRQRDGALPRGWVVVEPRGDAAGERDGSSSLVLTTRQGRQLPAGRNIGSLTIQDREILIIGPPPPSPTKPLPPLKKRQQQRQRPALPGGASDVKRPAVSPYSNGALAGAPTVRCDAGATMTDVGTDDGGGDVAEQRLRLQVSTMQGASMQLDASTDDTVLELKRKVLEVLGQPDEPPYHLALLFQGNPMADRSSLRLNGVVDGDYLVGDLVQPQSSAQPAAATEPPLGSPPREPAPPATPPPAPHPLPTMQGGPPAAALPPPLPTPPQPASPSRQARSTPPRTAASQRAHTRRRAEMQSNGAAHGGASPISRARRVVEPRLVAGGGPSRGGVRRAAHGERGVDELAHELGELARGIGGQLGQLGAGAAGTGSGGAALAGGMALYPTNLANAPVLLDAAAEQVAAAAAQMEALVRRYEGELGVGTAPGEYSA